MQKIKLVVVNEHTLGYILPELPTMYSILHSSILKGSPLGMWPGAQMISPRDKVRLASEADFDEYRVCFDGYKTCGKYEYAI